MRAIIYVCLGIGILSSGCKKNDVSSPYESRGNTAQRLPYEGPKSTKSSNLSSNIQIFIYPKSDFTHVMYLNLQKEIEKTKQRVESLIQNAKSEKERGNWVEYLDDVNSGSAFLSPFTLTNWSFIVPSRVFKPPGNIYLTIGRYQPDDCDIVFVVELKPDLTTKEARDVLAQIISNHSGERGDLIRNANVRTNGLFDTEGQVVDPYLNELLEGQVFIQQH